MELTGNLISNSMLLLGFLFLNKKSQKQRDGETELLISNLRMLRAQQLHLSVLLESWLLLKLKSLQNEYLLQLLRSPEESLPNKLCRLLHLLQLQRQFNEICLTKNMILKANSISIDSQI